MNTLLRTSAFCVLSFASASLGLSANFYLQANMPTGTSWLNLPSWFDGTSGGGNNAPAIGGNDFFLNGFSLRTAASASATSTFSGTSLNFGASGDILDLMAPTVNITNTVNASAGAIRIQSGRSSVTLSIGTLNLSGTGFQMRAPIASPNNHALTISLGNLTGSGRLNLGNLGGTDTGSFTLNVTNASTFSGEIRHLQGNLTFGSATNFGAGSLFLTSVSGYTINLANSVTFSSLAGNSFSALAAGTYDAAQLNTFTGSSVFTGASTLTVLSAIPEPSSAALLAGTGAFALVGLRRRRARG
jgi:hypothetical protein